MPYRFVLEVPEGVHQDAKIAVEESQDAEILIERHPHVLDPNDAFAELTVVCHSLGVVDNLYQWATTTGLRDNIFITAHKGPRVSLADHDAPTLRRLIQGDQYWFENTVPRITHRIDPVMEGGARVAEVPFGGRRAGSASSVPATTTLDLGTIDNVAVNVRDIRHAEEFYTDFFGMHVSYRARQVDDRWEDLGNDYTYDEGIRTGVIPEIVRLENGAVSIVLINVGAAATMYEPRVAYISLSVPMETLNHLRGRALFQNYPVVEDTPYSFGFEDPFGVVWQVVATSQ